MNAILVAFIIGSILGASITGMIARLVLLNAERFWNGRLDWWAERVSELDDQVNDLQRHHNKSDDADWWKDP